ncbi:MAG: NUDIX domain-containing protein [Candidatus Nanohaloarchaea archaeon]|nr:NUDIX domain-containing protein [Candidatus Nanohaloarchaea archaeon]
MSEGFTDVALGIVTRNDRILMVEREMRVDEFFGMVGFPGGDIESDEAPAQGAVRIVEQETNMKVDVRRKLGDVYQRLQFPDDSHHDAHLHVYEMKLVDERPLTEYAFWTDIDRLDHLDIIPSNITIFEQLYEKRDDEEAERVASPSYVSAIRKNRLGEYVQTAFESFDQGA